MSYMSTAIRWSASVRPSTIRHATITHGGLATASRRSGRPRSDRDRRRPGYPRYQRAHALPQKPLHRPFTRDLHAHVVDTGTNARAGHPVQHAHVVRARCSGKSGQRSGAFEAERHGWHPPRYRPVILSLPPRSNPITAQGRPGCRSAAQPGTRFGSIPTSQPGPQGVVVEQTDHAIRVVRTGTGEVVNTRHQRRGDHLTELHPVARGSVMRRLKPHRIVELELVLEAPGTASQHLVLEVVREDPALGGPDRRSVGSVADLGPGPRAK